MENSNNKFWKTGTHPIVGGFLSSGGARGNSKQFHEKNQQEKVNPKTEWR